MYGSNKNRMSVVARSSVGSGTFWGLVQQKGPWATTKKDIENAKDSMIQEKVGGGGIGEGGTIHAGHKNWKQVMNPHRIDATKPLPKPSSLAIRSVVGKESNQYHKKAVAGFLPQYDTLGKRSAADVGGHKAGGMGQQETREEPEIEYLPTELSQLPAEPFLTEERMMDVVKEEGVRMVPTHLEEKKGVVRTTKQKVRMTPYKVLSKEEKARVEKVKELMAERAQEKLYAAPSGLPKRPVLAPPRF